MPSLNSSLLGFFHLPDPCTFKCYRPVMEGVWPVRARPGGDGLPGA